MRVRTFFVTAVVAIFITAATPTIAGPRSVKRQSKRESTIVVALKRLRSFVAKGLGDHLSPPNPEPVPELTTTDPTVVCTTDCP